MRARWSALPLVLALATVPIAANAEVRLHGLFGDHMVLQREAPIPVWGWAEPGETVQLQFRGQSQTVRADAEGRWRVRLKPEAAGGPHVLTVSGSRSPTALTVGDVLVGEVWLCSGQSNMEWALRDSEDGPAEAAAANDTGMRHIKIAHRTATQPQHDIEATPWQPATAANAAEFSAVAYHFAKRLRRELGVPVGLLNVSWGGSQIESWMSREALLQQPDIAPLLAAMPASKEAFVTRYQARMEALLQVWQGSGVSSEAEAQAWASDAQDDSGWARLQAPGFWEAQGLPDLDGKVWMRKTVHLSEVQAASPGTVLHLAQVDDCDQTFVNGQAVGGQCGWDLPRRYAVAPGLLRAGVNVIAVRITDRGGGGGLHSKAEDLRLQFAAQLGLADLSLAGSWQARVESVLSKTEPDKNDLPSLLFNGMLQPVLAYGFKGMLWYQGESNVARAAQYERLLPGLIQDLRGRKGWSKGLGDFPFYQVQLAADQPWQLNRLTGSAWAELREAQTRTLRLPHTGLVVTSDVADEGNLHPRNKQVVGERLAGLALLQQKGGKNAWQAKGPVYRRMKLRGREIELHFDHAPDGLASTGSKLEGFTIADASGQFQPAQARIVGQTVLVHSDSIKHPVAVRFGWVDNPQQNNLFNRAGLPAVPFRTDRWPRLTEQARYAF